MLLVHWIFFCHFYPSHRKPFWLSQSPKSTRLEGTDIFPEIVGNTPKSVSGHWFVLDVKKINKQQTITSKQKRNFPLVHPHAHITHSLQTPTLTWVRTDFQQQFEPLSFVNAPAQSLYCHVLSWKTKRNHPVTWHDRRRQGQLRPKQWKKKEETNECSATTKTALTTK